MQKITPFLWFDDNAEEAVDFYVSIFKDSKILSAQRSGGKLFTATFQVEGQQFMVLNGGPEYKFTEAISLFVSCETQEEVDALWDRLVEGGTPSRCGWLKDRFGVSWQIIPTTLGRFMGDKDPVKAHRVMHAMLKMDKIDLGALQAAYEGSSEG